MSFGRVNRFGKCTGVPMYTNGGPQLGQIPNLPLASDRRVTREGSDDMNAADRKPGLELESFENLKRIA